MVHSSLRAFGRVDGGAATVVAALVDPSTPAGTILMPLFNHGQPLGPAGEGVRDPTLTPTANGTVPDTFWRLSGVRRSLGPTHPFAAWGRDAGRYLDGHHQTPTMGEDSPLDLLARDGGLQINLGTTHATSTAKHVAERMRRVPCLGRRTEAYPVRLTDGGVVEHRAWGWRAASGRSVKLNFSGSSGGAYRQLQSNSKPEKAGLLPLKLQTSCPLPQTGTL